MKAGEMLSDTIKTEEQRLQFSPATLRVKRKNLKARSPARFLITNSCVRAEI
jgi:hypothetical protein